MQILNLEQGSPEWLDARKGVITWTRLAKVLSKKADTRKGLIYELIAEKIAPTPEWVKTVAMERGNIIEEIVKENYPDIESAWFILKYDWLWLSPDWLVREAGMYTKAVEIKSPEPKNFVKYRIEKEIPEEYFWQVVQYFIVIDELESLDFIIYNPEIYDKHFRMTKITVTRDEMSQFIQQAKQALTVFREEWLDTLKIFVNS